MSTSTLNGSTVPTTGVPTGPPNRQVPTTPPGPRLPLPVRRRRPGYLALAVLLIVGLGAVGGYLYLQAGKKVPVVVVVAEVPVGHVIQRSDVSTVDVAGDVTAIAGEHLGSVVGQTATVTLLPGMLLQRSMIAAGTLLAAGQAEVGISAVAGSLPADGLSPGDTVEVVGLRDRTGSSPSADDQQPQVLAARATVFACVANPSQPGGFLVTLVVDQGIAAQIAAANSAGRVALVVVP